MATAEGVCVWEQGEEPKKPRVAVHRDEVVTSVTSTCE